MLAYPTSLMTTKLILQVIYVIPVAESIQPYIPLTWSSLNERDGSTIVSITPFTLFYASAILACVLTATKQIITGDYIDNIYNDVPLLAFT